MDESAKQREAVKSAYPNSKSWANRVANMSDTQVAAIYLRFKSENKINL